jgi:hypothetical protein
LRQHCRLVLTFFGLPPTYRPVVHQEVFSLIYFGKGGFTWQDVMKMPIWLRKFYIKQIEQVVEEQNKQNQKAQRKANSKSLAKPGIAPRK